VCFLFFGLNFTCFLREAFGLGEKEDVERVEEAMAWAACLLGDDPHSVSQGNATPPKNCMHFVKLDLGQQLFFASMTIFHWEVSLGFMKPQLAVLFLPLQQTCIICLRIYPLHRAFCSFL
jgi:hypothetical protein